jgi:hypothetical protein
MSEPPPESGWMSADQARTLVGDAAFLAGISKGTLLEYACRYGYAYRRIDVLKLMPRTRHGGYQIRRVQAALRRLYPNGLPSKTELTTSALHRQIVADALFAAETKQLGQRDPSWQVVERAR